MEALSAIGLIGNVITFLEFGYKLATAGERIRASVSGTSTRNDDLAAMARQLASITADLRASTNVGDGSNRDKELQELLSECDVVAADLEALLNTLKASGSRSRWRGLSIAIRDWRKKEEKNELEGRLDRCKNQLSLHINLLMRSELVDRLNKLVAHGEASEAELRYLKENIGPLRVGTQISCLSAEALEQIRSIVQLSDEAADAAWRTRVLHALRFDLVNERFENIDDAHKSTFNWIYDDRQTSQGTSASTVTSASSRLELGKGRDPYCEIKRQTRKRELQRAFKAQESTKFVKAWTVHDELDDSISSLNWHPPLWSPKSTIDDDVVSESVLFSALNSRPKERQRSSYRVPTDEVGQQVIHEVSAHHVAQTRDFFITWLRQGRGVFHVSGKAGSGKSTLMKFLWRHPTTREHLEFWADGKKLVMGKFFFWRPGPELQKSVKGLIRGLLHSLLSRCPELVSAAFPTLERMPTYDDHLEMGNDQYAEAFDRITSTRLASPHHKFAFFIDGLDEFNGNHADLIRKLRSWSDHNQSVKLCVSSRDWATFTDGFRDCPRLNLQELTQQDIKCFVEARFAEMETEDTSERCSEDPHTEIQRLICDRADGVFLWVKLVLRQIEEGLGNGDQISDLLQIVESLPTELELMFEQLLTMIPKQSRKLAMTLMSVTSACRSQVPSYEFRLLHMSFLEEYLTNQECASTAVNDQVGRQETMARLDRARKRVYGVCKGLLELRPPSASKPRASGSDEIDEIDDFDEIERELGWQVCFTHRSIIEFLDGIAFKKCVRANVPELDISSALWQSYLCMIQHVGLSREYFVPSLRASLRAIVSRSFVSLDINILTSFPFLRWFHIPSPARFVRDVIQLTAICLRASDFSDHALQRMSHFWGLVMNAVKFIGLDLSPCYVFYGTTVLGAASPLLHALLLFASGFGLHHLFLPRLNHMSHSLKADCMRISFCIFLSRGTLSIDINPRCDSRSYQMIAVLLAHGTPIDVPICHPRIPLFHQLIAGTEDFPGVPKLGPLAFMLFNGANPRFSIKIGAQPYAINDRKRALPDCSVAVKATYKTEYPSAKIQAFEVGERYWLNPLQVVIGAMYANLGLQLTPTTKKFTCNYSRRHLSLRTLVEIWYPDHYSILQQTIDFVSNFNTDLGSSERLELQRRFGDGLRQLFDEKHPEFIGHETMKIICGNAYRKVPLLYQTLERSEDSGDFVKISWEYFDTFKRLKDDDRSTFDGQRYVVPKPC